MGFLAREHAHQPTAKAIWRSLTGALVVATLLDCAPAIGLAEGITSPPGNAPAVTEVTISSGDGGQSDRQVNGTLVSYTDNSGLGSAYYVKSADAGAQRLNPQASSIRRRKPRRL